MTCQHFHSPGFSGVICFTNGFEGELAKCKWGDPEEVWGAIIQKDIRGSDAWEMTQPLWNSLLKLKELGFIELPDAPYPRIPILVVGVSAPSKEEPNDEHEQHE